MKRKNQSGKKAKFRKFQVIKQKTSIRFTSMLLGLPTQILKTVKAPVQLNLVTENVLFVQWCQATCCIKVVIFKYQEIHQVFPQH